MQSPTKFDLSLHPLHTVKEGQSNTAQLILHIKAKPLSRAIPPYTPPLPILDKLATILRPIHPPHSNEGNQDEEEWYTSFHLVIEPLILGIVPRTAIPAIILILVFGISAGCCVPAIIRFIEGVHLYSNGLEIKGVGKKVE